MLLCITQFSNQRIVRRAEHGHKQVEHHEQHKEDHVVYGVDTRLRQGEEPYCHQSEGDCDGTHERDSATALVLASVGPSGNQGIGDCVKNPSHSQNEAKEREFEEDRILRDA